MKKNKQVYNNMASVNAAVWGVNLLSHAPLMSLQVMILNGKRVNTKENRKCYIT